MHMENTPFGEMARRVRPGVPRAGIRHPEDRQPAFRRRPERGPNGNYLYELTAQPGGPEGRPDATAGSKPIAENGQPQGVRSGSPPNQELCGKHSVLQTPCPKPGESQ